MKLSKTQKKQLQLTEDFVKAELALAEAGHDWMHIQRVLHNADAILKKEDANPFVVNLACYLHDIADAKFHCGDEEIGSQKTQAFLSEIGVEDRIIEQVVFIVRYVSFKSDTLAPYEKSIEFKIVQDADRLDAIGAIGIARTFHYGGYKNRPIYDPSLTPKPNQTKKEYKSANSPTINHFYEKLLRLKDSMHTATGNKLAVQRHDFMLQFLEQFFEECGYPSWDMGLN